MSADNRGTAEIKCWWPSERTGEFVALQITTTRGLCGDDLRSLAEIVDQLDDLRATIGVREEIES